MKTIEEIKKHLSDVCYDDYAQNMIYGFLIGTGDIEDGEWINWKSSDEKDFSEFMDWYNKPNTDFKEEGLSSKGFKISKETQEFYLDGLTRHSKLYSLRCNLEKMEDIISELEKNPSGDSVMSLMLLELSKEIRDKILKKIEQLEKEDVK